MAATLQLEIPGRLGFLPIATTFAQHAALDFGLDDESATSLSLAVEEIVAALCQMGLPDLQLKLAARNVVYYTELTVSLPYYELALGKMNLTAAVQEDADFDHIGWMVAAQMVDNFTIEHQGKRLTTFKLRKHRRYAPFEGRVSMPEVGAVMTEIRPGTPQELILFAQRVHQSEQEPLHAMLLDPPSRLVGLVQSGEYEALLGFSDRGDPVAGVLIDRTRSPMALMMGPYLIGQPESTIAPLLHAVLEHLARSPFDELVAETVNDFPPGEMESLGGRSFGLEDGRTIQARWYYRPLREDHGTVSWSTPWLEEFLRREYQRLTLPRDIQTWRELPASGSGASSSLYSCLFERRRSECLIRPVAGGDDAEQNLAEHLRLLKAGGVLNATFELDLGQPFHLSFAAALQANGFRPAFLLPSAGKGDLLILEGSPP